MFSNDFVKAEHKYRIDKMRDQHKSGRFGRTAAAVVVAALLSAALAACGVPAEADAGAVVHGRVFVDQAPSWQPNERLLRDFLRSYRGDTQAVIPEVEFGRMTAPSWDPNYGRLETLLGAVPTSGPR